MPLVDADPVHLRSAHRVGVLERTDPGEIGGEALHHELNLHLADPRNVVIVFLDTGLDLGNGVADRVPGGVNKKATHVLPPKKGGVALYPTYLCMVIVWFDDIMDW